MKALVIILMAFSCLSCSSTTSSGKVPSIRDGDLTNSVDNSVPQERLEEKDERQGRQVETGKHLKEQLKRPDNQKKNVILQYRMKLDAVFPSSFVLVTENAISVPLRIVWDLPDGKRKEKQAFDALIRELEKKEINGVEFECRAEQLPTGELRVLTVPQLTKKGRERIKEH